MPASKHAAMLERPVGFREPRSCLTCKPGMITLTACGTQSSTLAPGAVRAPPRHPPATAAYPPERPGDRSPRRRLEEAQVRRRLVLLGRHQISVRAQDVVLLADDDVDIAGNAKALRPLRTQIRIVLIAAIDAPRPRQGVVDNRNLLVEGLRVIPVEMKPLPEDRLIV